MNYKKIIFSVVIILIIVEILMFPSEAISYAATGLTLWFQNMVPALFPFMVLSGLIIRLDLAPSILKILHPLLYKVFRTDIYCEYAILMGFLCGYPMGAIIIKDLLAQEKISLKQADYLLTFCNNIGPVFFCSLVLPVFDREYHKILLLGMYGVPLAYGLFMRYTVFRNVFFAKDCQNTSPQKQISASRDVDFSNAFTDSLNQAVSASLFLGGCMIFFNMLRFLPMHYFENNILLSSITSWLLEVNGALFMTKDLYACGLKMTSLLLIPFLAVGGLSCLCQTIGILSSTQCNVSKYMFHKIMQWLIWLMITLLWLLTDILREFYVWNAVA